MAFTYFFRDRFTLELIVQHVLPKLQGHRYFHIWDAGCAHGPEPYSLAMMLREHMSRFLFRNVRIYATDLDPADRFGRTITAGLYPEGEIRRVPPAIRRKYFTAAEQPGWYRVVEEIRTRITFIKHDLLCLQPVRFGFSLIVCKNVLLHFSARQRLEVVRMFYQALRPEGFLVTERTQPLPEAAGRWFAAVTAQGQLWRRVEPEASAAREAAGAERGG